MKLTLTPEQEAKCLLVGIKLVVERTYGKREFVCFGNVYRNGSWSNYLVRHDITSEELIVTSTNPDELIKYACNPENYNMKWNVPRRSL